MTPFKPSIPTDEELTAARAKSYNPTFFNTYSFILHSIEEQFFRYLIGRTIIGATCGSFEFDFKLDDGTTFTANGDDRGLYCLPDFDEQFYWDLSKACDNGTLEQFRQSRAEFLNG